MKLLLDQNLSRRLVPQLTSVFPGTTHAALEGLGEASDEAVWTFARAGGFVIVSKDSDFVDRSALLGHPPKVIRLALGNCTTAEALGSLMAGADVIAAFGQDEEAAALEIGPAGEI